MQNEKGKIMRHVNKDRAAKLIEKGAILIDMRNAVAFRDGHIKGAKNLTLKYFVNHLMTISDKKSTILIYGDTLSESELKHGVNYADQLGFSKIYTALYHDIK